ncbi:MAG: class I SAM-dependent methyltransferase [candidate division Zixibacteria bacterium]|nr:class I SAM-dependent methyltransferase [candidate division Zixibacteria bacterium]NIR63678.1 class I SAM-dependent methyltransferase [candidate division Zixibacteria bacterium]NIS18329.1 class I SAM-dependent methyltransferase [candidate division Zixibacteria bacterium]NIS45631.1 class I SAM-dependent methyltransferase [candidate division Zixibacteria bacterium]NIT54656.1 class I SAM-dependent methyltransferase [candidate division Zixibacteria bacterium]
MFYDEISEYYDQMIPLEKRIDNLKKQLSPFIKKYDIKTALDVGSATGATCIALTELGVDPVGIELSSRMVKIAKEHARQAGMKIKFLKADMLDDRPDFKSHFNAIFVLANTISHLLDKKSLDRAIANFRKWLSPGGSLVIQLLNYHRILRDRQRIVKIYNNLDRIFIRFYDFGNDLINFNLLTVENQPGVCDYTMSSVPLRGWKANEITDVLKKKGYTSIRKYGNIKGVKFDRVISNDLVILARKKDSH